MTYALYSQWLAHLPLNLNYIFFSSFLLYTELIEILKFIANGYIPCASNLSQLIITTECI